MYYTKRCERNQRLCVESRFGDAKVRTESEVEKEAQAQGWDEKI